ncbi:band 4.1-like protein 4, partial [Tachysurus ichikawai]
RLHYVLVKRRASLKINELINKYLLSNKRISLLRGQTPSEAELNYLSVAKTLEMYGVDLHPVFGEKQSEYFLGLTPVGVVVYKNKTQVGKYFWPRITKVFFKETQFELRVLGKD